MMRDIVTQTEEGHIGRQTHRQTGACRGAGQRVLESSRRAEKKIITALRYIIAFTHTFIHTNIVHSYAEADTYTQSVHT
jgi:hypothetical protein